MALLGRTNSVRTSALSRSVCEYVCESMSVRVGGEAKGEKNERAMWEKRSVLPFKLLLYSNAKTPPPQITAESQALAHHFEFILSPDSFLVSALLPCHCH